MSSMCRALIWITLVRCLLSLWSSHSSSRTGADYGFAVGSYNGTISLIGGFGNAQGLTIFDTDTEAFYDEPASPLTANIFGMTQFYTQSQDDILYMISEDSTHLISTYDLDTEEFVSSFETGHDDAGSLACLASNGDYLFIIGGGITLGTDSLNTFQIFDVPGASWLTGANNMLTARAALACVEASGHVWALGGFETANPLNSTERISSRGDMTANAWEASPIQLLDAVVYARAVAHKHLIYVIGGLEGSTIVDTVQIINTLTEEVNTLTEEVTRDTLAYAVDATGGIFYSPFLYAFGGRTADNPVESKATFLYFDTTTDAPTLEPTAPPTKNPSDAPSEAPSRNPSIPPTRNPSSAPTHPPSSNPSASPSSPPSGAPIAATVEPSETPTSLPTNAPTGVSSEPSSAPTDPPTDKTTKDDGKGGGGSGGKGGAQNDGMGILIGLSVAVIVVLIVLLVVGLYYLRKKDRQYEEEKKVRQAVQGAFEDQRGATGGLDEDDVLRQVMALSALEQHRKVSLQAQPPQQAKPAKAGDLGTVKEDDTTTGDKDAEKKGDKGKEDKDKDKGKDKTEKQSAALLSAEKEKDNDTGVAIIAVETADSDDEKAEEADTAGAQEKAKEDETEDKGKKEDSLKDEPVIVEMVEKKEDPPNDAKKENDQDVKKEKEENQGAQEDEAEAAPKEEP